MEQSIGVFGKEAILWACLLRQSSPRPQAQVVHQHASYLLDELKRSPEALELPLQSVDDGIFAIAALIDEIAMGQPDLRAYWSQYSLQSMRFASNSAGVEVFERARRVFDGPTAVIATFAVVLGVGFQGCYGLPGADRYALGQLRRDLSTRLGVDPGRDWKGGVLRAIRPEEAAHLERFAQPWFKTVVFGRVLAALLLLAAATTAGLVYLHS